MNSPYTGTIDSRKRTLQARNRSRQGSEEQLFRSRDRVNLMLECNDLYRNDCMGRSVVDRFVKYAIWKGIFPKPVTSDKEWNKIAADGWIDLVRAERLDDEEVVAVADEVAQAGLVAFLLEHIREDDHDALALATEGDAFAGLGETGCSRWFKRADPPGEIMHAPLTAQILDL